MITKLISSSLHHLLKQIRFQAHYRFEPITKNNGHQDYMRPEIPRSYFNNKLDGIDERCKEIISQILQRPDNVARHQQLLDRFLDLHASVNRPKQAKDLLCLLVAINMNNQPRLNNFIKTLLEHLMRNKIQEATMDEVQLSCFSQIMKDALTNNSIQRAKYQHMIFTYLHILESHFQLIRMKDYQSLVNLLVDQKKNRFYFVKFALKFQDFLVDAYINPWLTGSSNQKLQKFMKSNSLVNLLRLMNEYNCTPQNGAKVYTYIHRLYLQQRLSKGHLSFQYLIKLFRYFPVWARAADGTSYKSKIFNAVISYSEQKNISQFVGKYESLAYLFGYAAIHHCFYQAWMNLNFSQVNGFIFLQKSEVKEPPVLPNFFWQVYSHYNQQVSTQPIVRETIKSLYPTKYIKTKLKETRQTKEPTSQSEMRIRMQIVLMNLKISYKKQVYMQSRYIDFLLEDKIVLELDGILHYDPLTFKNDQRSVYRNLHLLLAGYRLIVINIQEYNFQRQVPQLTELFRQKLNILKEYDCAAVI